MKARYIGASLGIIVVLALAGYLFWMMFFENRVDLPEGETTNTTITVNEDVMEEKEVFTTDGTLHSIPLEEVLSGGPARDGIPPIDDPKFIDVEKADKFLTDDETGLAISIEGVNRFYPYQILVWHEIVNDTINGQRVLVTYCPLCVTGIVFDPLVEGERVEFGTSGKLWNSNLLMYDRKTESLWSQVLGEAVVGSETGKKLDVVSSDVMQWKTWKATFPEGEVLSRNTGAERFYGSDPYGDYYTTPGVFFPLTNSDDRLDDKAFVMGVIINDEIKAYPTETIKEVVEVEDEVGGQALLIRYEMEEDVVRIYKKQDDGSLERINPIPGFWFSWAAAHPDTDLYQK